MQESVSSPGLLGRFCAQRLVVQRQPLQRDYGLGVADPARSQPRQRLRDGQREGLDILVFVVDTKSRGY